MHSISLPPLIPLEGGLKRVLFMIWKWIIYFLNNGLCFFEFQYVAGIDEVGFQVV